MSAPFADETVIDFAGATTGGAGRFRAQYLSVIGRAGIGGSTAIGLEETVTPSWLARRELVARRARKVVAANNVGTVFAGAERWTLLRNANHFLTESEWASSRHHFDRRFRMQIPIVRATARKADVLVAPSQSMAERVVRILPSVRDRIHVRFHPLTPPERETPSMTDRRVILCPVVPSPYKNLDEHLRRMASALRGRDDIEVVMTMRPDEAPAELQTDPRFRFCGILGHEQLARIYRTCSAVYYPTLVESFGYPLAEARAAGIPILAQNIAHNRDIAGGALFGFEVGEDQSLPEAMDRAFSSSLVPDPAPFEPASYFEWLLA